MNPEFKRMMELAGLIEIKINLGGEPNKYGEIQAAEDEFKGGMETGDYTEEEYLEELLDASDEELMDLQGGYYDIAKVLSDLGDKEKQEAIRNVKRWAQNKLA
jgi:hypothetical protein